MKFGYKWQQAGLPGFVCLFRVPLVRMGAQAQQDLLETEALQELWESRVLKVLM